MEEPTSVQNQDEDRLAQLGYKQELRRDWSLLHNFGVSFSIIVSFSPFIRFCRSVHVEAMPRQ